MKTDELFYELFTIDPKSLFRLVQVELDGEYAFESLTIKTTEKRLDGFCHRIDGIGPNVFVEIQGYKELDTMLHLTPIEETLIGKELIQIGKHEGRQEGVKLGEKRGMTKGELIGEIRLAQRLLKRPISPPQVLARKSVKELKAIMQAFDAELATLTAAPPA